MLEILIDYRENKLKGLFDKHIFKDKKQTPQITYENLDVGDIIIKKDGKLLLIFERKSIPDLYSSINDGRYKEQKIRLINNFPLRNVVYIIENANTQFLEKKFKNFKSIVNGAIINSIFRDKIRVIKTNDINQTFEYLITIIKKIYNNFDFFKDLIKLEEDQIAESNNTTTESNNTTTEPKDNAYLETIKIKKSDNNDPRKCNIAQMSHIPGVSIKIASCVLTKYKSLYNLILEYSRCNSEDKKEKLLKDLQFEIANNKVRKIGPVISKRIYNYYCFQ
jgi:ERCC4-type nuclease